MPSLIGAGLIALLLGFGIRYSWTRPKRPYELRGAALGAVRAAQSVMVIGAALLVIGVIASVAKLF